MKYKFLIAAVILLAITLRLYKVSQVPPSLYWDEVSLGYNAYSIAESGYDEHGEFLPLARFIAFGDYKPSGYIYTAVPFIKLLDLNELSIRFPSILAGVIMVVVTYLLVQELFKSQIIALLASFLLAISPWSIHLSRAAFEANLAAAFNLSAVYFFVLSIRKKWTVILSFVFLVLSFYTFNANRIIAPLLIFALLIIYWRESLKNYKWILTSVILSILLLLPSIGYLMSSESRLRFQEVSIFNNLEPLRLSNQRIEYDGGTLFAKLLHNRRLVYAGEFLKHYFDNFSGRFLITSGDINPRLSVQEVGELYFIELPFLLLGIFFLVKKRHKTALLIAVWMLIVPIPAGMAKETPHALRIVSILPTYQIITAYGLYFFSKFLVHRLSLIVRSLMFFVLCFLFLVNIYYYLHIYYIHFPVKWSGEWQYGSKQMVEYVTKVKDDYDYVFVTDGLGRPYIFFALYDKLTPAEFLRIRQASRDWFGFWKVERLGKIFFGMDKLKEARGNILMVTTPGNLPAGYAIIERITNLKNEEVFLIAEKHEN